MSAFMARVAGLLTGEPARIIGYGAAVIIWVVARLVGVIPDQSPDQALESAVAAIAIVASIVESIRHLVYSPATVASIKAGPSA